MTEQKLIILLCNVRLLQHNAVQLATNAVHYLANFHLKFQNELYYIYPKRIMLCARLTIIIYN